MQKKQVWSCPNNCPVTATPCRHLEKLIAPKRAKACVVTVPYTSIEQLTASDVPQANTQQSVGEFKTKLRTFKLREFQISLLTDRFMYNMSYSQIANERGYTSARDVYKLIKSALNDLNKRGYGKR